MSATIRDEVYVYKLNEASPTERRWICAIMRVSPKTTRFWEQYTQKYDEQLLMKISEDRDLKGRRCCDVLVFSKRSAADVVVSAWSEYNDWLMSDQNWATINK